MRSGRWDEALAIAASLARSGDTRVRAQAKYWEGLAHYMAIRYESADQALSTSVQMSEALGDAKSTVRALGALARAKAALADFDRATDVALSALERAEALADKALALSARFSLACVYAEMTDFDSARPLLEQVVNDAAASGDTLLVADAMVKLCWIDCAQFRRDIEYGSPRGSTHIASLAETVSQLLRATEKAGLQGTYHEAIARTAQTFVCVHQRDLECARSNAEKGMVIAERLSSPVLLSGMKMAMAEVHLESGSFADAQASVAEAIDLAARARNAALLYGARLMQARVLQRRGMFEEAMIAYRSLLGAQRQFLVARSEPRARVGKWRHDAERERDHLLHLSHTDSLTGVSTRLGLSEIADSLHAASLCEIAALMVDIDDFKRINDERSHGVGDIVLAEIGRIIRSTIRSVDLAVRYGGDEFLILLIGAEPNAAAVLRTRLLEQVAAHSWSDVGWPVTLSVGIAEGRSDDDIGRVIAIADEAMYVEKRMKRECSLGRGHALTSAEQANAAAAH